MDIERRYFPVSELRAKRDDDDSLKISGYAAVFDELSEEMFGIREKIDKGAFRDTIRQDDVRALWNHDPNYVLGRNRAGTLTLEEDDEGLYVEIDPPDAQWARDVVESIQRGDVDQMSFGFQIIEEEANRDDPDNPIYTLRKVKLFDVSPVTFPAYPQTSVQARDVLSDLGIDIKSLNSVLARAQRGMELRDSDRDLIKASIDVLSDLIGEGRADDSDPGEDEGHEDDLSLELEKRKRQLELIELENRRFKDES